MEAVNQSCRKTVKSAQRFPNDGVSSVSASIEKTEDKKKMQSSF